MSELLQSFNALSLDTRPLPGRRWRLMSRHQLPQHVCNPSVTGKGESLLASAPFFQRAKTAFDKIKYALQLPEQSFYNFQRLAQGYLGMPVILLMNPTASHETPYESMINETRTLQYLQDEYLPFLNLTLEDVVVIDVYPFLTDNKLAAKDLQTRSELASLAFGVTWDFFNTFRPKVVISCQCRSGSADEKFGFFDDPLANDLRSSMNGARNSQIKCLEFNGSDVHIAQAFHPSVFLNHRTGDEQKSLKKIWEDILDSYYLPYKPFFQRLPPKTVPQTTYQLPQPPFAFSSQKHQMMLLAELRLACSKLLDNITTYQQSSTANNNELAALRRACEGMLAAQHQN